MMPAMASASVMFATARTRFVPVQDGALAVISLSSYENTFGGARIQPGAAHCGLFLTASRMAP